MKERLERSYELIVAETRRMVEATFAPEAGVVCFASGLLVDPNDPGRATFSVAVRRHGSGRTCYFNLFGACVAIRERGRPEVQFPAAAEAIGHMRTLVDALALQPPQTWGD